MMSKPKQLVRTIIRQNEPGANCLKRVEVIGTGLGGWRQVCQVVVRRGTDGVLPDSFLSRKGRVEFSTVAMNPSMDMKGERGERGDLKMKEAKETSIIKNPNVMILFDKNVPETVGQRIYRYLDITGFFTRYHNRKEWIMDLDPYTRLPTVMLTEYERKLIVFMKFHVYLLFVICLYLWYEAQVHFAMKPPCPKPLAYQYLDGRKRDFSWHGRFFFMYPKARCKECRWLDVQCKKECFDKLKQEGHKFILNKGDPLSKPKTVLHPPQFH